MQEDMHALESEAYGDKVALHLYRWPSCISYGILLDPQEWLDEMSCTRLNLPLVKRPTGGGIIYHIHDLSFGLIVPKSHPAAHLSTLERYYAVNMCVVEAMSAFTKTKKIALQSSACSENRKEERFCLAHATQYDLVVDGLKVGGAAQRRLKTGFLHQGSVTLHLPELELLESTLRDKYRAFAELMHSASMSLMDRLPEEEDRIGFERCLVEAFQAF